MIGIDISPTACRVMAKPADALLLQPIKPLAFHNRIRDCVL
jgi:hypothetical protein